VDVIASKRIAFVHFASVNSALKCKAALSQEPQWARFRLNFGPDRCAPGGKHKQYAGKIYGGMQQAHWAPHHAPVYGGSGGGMGAMDMNNANRTVWLGGAIEGVTEHALCNVVRGGLVEEIRMLPEKKCAFVTFVRGADAALFIQTHANGLEVSQGTKLKVGWGKPTPFRKNVAAAVAQGATRNLFLGGVDDSLSEDRLRADLSKFGVIEKVNVLLEKKIAFVNFTSINATLNCAAELRNPESELHQQGYGVFKVNFGKDRCAGVRQMQRGRGGGQGQAGFGNVAPAGNNYSMGHQAENVYMQRYAANSYSAPLGY
jgi:hypothetical protein